MTIAMMIATIAAFAQMEITKNKVEAGAEFMMGSYNPLELEGSGWVYDAKEQYMSFTVPGVNYLFEAKPNDMFKLYLHGRLAYMMSKGTYDGEAPTGKDTYASAIALELNPMAKVYLPNNLFVKIGLPFGYMNYTPQIEDADAIPMQGLDLNACFGFDNREIEMHGLTPWNLFEKGILFQAMYEMGIMASKDGEDVEELASYFGILGAYAYYADAMMVKPYVSYKMGMNDKVDENGYVHVGADFAKDFNEQFNLVANLDFGMTMLPEEDDAGNDAYNTLSIGVTPNYYVMPELDIFVDLGLSMDLTSEEVDPGIAYGLGAIYTFNLLK